MRKQKAEVVNFNMDTVFAAACAAQRINGKYARSAEYVFDESVSAMKQVCEANKTLTHKILTEPGMSDQVTDSDREQSQTIRSYYQCKLMDILSNSANDFTKMVVSIASKEEIRSNDMHAIAIIACLPHSYVRSIENDKRNELKMDAMIVSQHFGNIGDRVSGECEIVDSRYSMNWNTYYNSAKFNNNMILFSYKSQLEVGKTYEFSGTVKSHRENNLTQLNRVKIK